MKLRVIWVGKTRESYLEEGIRLYTQRIRRYAPLETLAVRGEKIAASRNRQALLAREEERILRVLRPRERIIVLDPAGDGMSSEEFSSFLQDLRSRAFPSAAFILGGPLGIGPRVVERAHRRLRLSSLTLTHEMARLLLLEQIYRAFTILAGEPYHK